MRVREIKKYRDHKAICSMDPGIKFSMCSESRIHKIIQVSWFKHNGTWFHSSTNFRVNRPDQRTEEKKSVGNPSDCCHLQYYTVQP